MCMNPYRKKKKKKVISLEACSYTPFAEPSCPQLVKRDQMTSLKQIRHPDVLSLLYSPQSPGHFFRIFLFGGSASSLNKQQQQIPEIA